MASRRFPRTGHFLCRREAWLGGGDNGTILSTSDGGAVWSQQSSGTTNNLWSVYFMDDGKRGGVVGNSGTILVATPDQFPKFVVDNDAKEKVAGKINILQARLASSPLLPPEQKKYEQALGALFG